MLDRVQVLGSSKQRDRAVNVGCARRVAPPPRTGDAFYVTLTLVSFFACVFSAALLVSPHVYTHVCIFA